MNAFRTTIVAFAALAALGAFADAARADDITPDPYQHMVSTRTRAEVVAERDAAVANGDIAAQQGEDSGSAHFARLVPPSLRTRAQVLAEVLAARRDGSHEAITGEDSGSFHFAAGHHADSPSVQIARVVR